MYSYGTVEYFVNRMQEDIISYRRFKSPTECISQIVHSIVRITFGSNDSDAEKLYYMNNLYHAIKIVEKSIR